MLKLSVAQLGFLQGTVNNGLLMSWFQSLFPAESRLVQQQKLKSVQFASEVTGLKMSAEIKSGGGGGERKEIQ